MRSWLEKLNSLSRGMLFSRGYLAPSAVEEIALNCQRNGACSIVTAPQDNIAAPHLARTLVCGALQITLR